MHPVSDNYEQGIHQANVYVYGLTKRLI